MIAAGQSVFRVVVEAADSLSSGDEPVAPPSRTASLAAGTIRCAGCGTPAPASLTIAGPVGARRE